MFIRLLPPVFSILLALPLASSSLRAQQATPTATPAPTQVPNYDAASILSTIRDLKTKQPNLVNKEKSAVLANINNAIADPAKAYEQAITAVDLQGAGGGSDGTKLGEWRKRNGDLLRNREFLNVLRLNLIYLSITWQHSMGVKVKDLMVPLLEYVGQLDRLPDTIWMFDITKHPLGDNVFVKYFQIGPYISTLTDWSDQIFSPDSIREKTILPELRTEKSPRLLGYWNDVIQLESAHAAASGNGLVTSRFNNVRRPSLLWGRAEDELLLGQQNQAVADMLALIKAHPDHPDFDHWTTQLTQIITPPQGDVVVGPATVVSPSPTATVAP